MNNNFINIVFAGCVIFSTITVILGTQYRNILWVKFIPLILAGITTVVFYIIAKKSVTVYDAMGYGLLMIISLIVFAITTLVTALVTILKFK